MRKERNLLKVMVFSLFFASVSILFATETTPGNLSSAGKTAGERRVITVKGVEYAFRWCPPGNFEMGSPKEEQWRGSDEQLHTVRLTHGFWLLETEVTQEMWESVMGKNPSDFYKGGITKLYPVECVSWVDCQAFCKKLSALSNAGTFRLPSEAQWEYACRAGSTGAYGGTGKLDEMGWCDDYRGRTHEVKRKKANAWGFYDMHGNVWEWCSDWYGSAYYENWVSDDPVGPENGTCRVLRGGSWFSDARNCRSAGRSGSAPDYRDSNFGFRVALQQQ